MITKDKETILINSIITNNEILEAIGFLQPKHFLRESVTFEFIKNIYERKGSVSLIDLILDGVDYDYDTEKADSTQTAVIIAKKIFDDYQAQLIKRSIKRLDYSSGIDQVLAQLRLLSETIEGNYVVADDVAPVDIGLFIEQMRELRQAGQKCGGLMVNSLPTYNQIVGGMLPGDLIGIYGKEKSTKTTLTHQILLDLCLDQKIPVGIFNFEMDVLQLLMKTMSMRTGIDQNILRNPHGNKISDDEFNLHAIKIAKDFEGATLLISDDILDEQQIYNRAKDMVNHYGVKAIVIDYLLLIDPSIKVTEFRLAINHLTKFFKRMARKLKVVVILVSQANDSGSREAEGKGLSRDSNYYFYVEALAKGQTVEIGNYSHVASEGDYVVVNRGIRHTGGNKAFITRFIDNKYREIAVDIPNNFEGLNTGNYYDKEY